MTAETGFQPDFNHISDAFAEEGDFTENLPFSDLNRWISEDSLIKEAAGAFRIWGRLHEIRALSFLSYVGPNPEKQYFIGYTHSRLDHSLVVSIAAGEIARLNNLSQTDRNTLEIAGLLHDIATPALGDATKSIDSDNLGEEKFWQELLDKKGRAFLKEREIKIETIDEIIKNRGILGQILDIADRITYTMKDLHNVIGETESKINIHPYLIELRYPLSHYPQIGNIYKDVVVDQNKGTVFLQTPINLVYSCFLGLLCIGIYTWNRRVREEIFLSQILLNLYIQRVTHDL